MFEQILLTLIVLGVISFLSAVVCGLLGTPEEPKWLTFILGWLMLLGGLSIPIWIIYKIWS